MVKVAPSILAADFANLESELKRIEDHADWVHVDVMDGAFVPNITIGAPVVKSLKKSTKLPLDVHLMINEPHNHIPDFIKSGADIITFHLEAYDFDEKKINDTISLIKGLGAKVGISINPSTDIKKVEPYIKDINMVLIMSVNPGFGGQKFIESAYDKIQNLLEILQKNDLKAGNNLNEGEVAIEVDGGIYPGEISEKLIATGANVLVAGSAVYGATDIPQAIEELKNGRKD
ncbi:MAG: ribulose-phosphate 3-epimerase [Candidatus Caenarcaniphilales bacterium]|nr:ribulose-phosphate 3-epimerase [Candidatus Caenarcaniphilales bacterium]